MTDELHDYVIIDSSDEIGQVPDPVSGWVITEKIGIAIINPRGISAVRKSVVIGDK